MPGWKPRNKSWRCNLIESQNGKIKVVKQTQNTRMSKMREDFFTHQAFEPSAATASTTELGLIVKQKIEHLLRV